MSYSIDFVNNEKYGADDVNGIRALIMTEGIIKTGETDCLVTLAQSSIEIAPGQALFDDGCRIEVTEKETLSHNGSDCYVFFDRNYSGDPKPKAGDTLPDGCVPLARISGGELTDLRNFSCLRVPSMQKNRYDSKEFTLNFDLPNPEQAVISITFENRSEIKYMILENTYNQKTTKLFFNYEDKYVFGFDDKYQVYISTDQKINLYALSTSITVNNQGNTLTFNTSCPSRLNLGIFKVTIL